MPFGGVNPSIRVYDYDIERRRIMNYKQYYLPLEEIYSIGTGDLVDEAVEDTTKTELLLSDRSSRNSKFMESPMPSRQKRDSTTKEKSKKLGKKGTGTPKWLLNDKYEICLDTTGKIKCLPSTPPKGCDQTIWKKMRDWDISDKPPMCSPANEAERKSEIVEETVTVKTVNDTNETLDSDNLGPTPNNSSLDHDIEEDSDVDNNKGNTNLQGDNTSMITDDTNRLIEKWKLAFNAAEDLNISVSEGMTPEAMYNAWLDMKNGFKETKFNLFYKDLVVLKSDFQCNETCHAYIMCSISKFIFEDVQECLMEKGFEPPSLWGTVASEHITEKSEDTTTQYNTPPSVMITTKTNKNTVSTTEDTEKPTTKASSRFPQSETIIVPNSPGQRPNDQFPEDMRGNTEDYKEDENVSGASQEGGGSGVTIVVVLMFCVIILVGAIVLYRRKYHWRNRQSDEFLLTDSVFKYDGYSQVDQP